MEGYATLVGFFRPVMIDDGYGLTECSGFVVKSGSVPLITNSKEKEHVIYSSTGETILKIAIPREDGLKEYDQKLLFESGPEQLVEISVLKLTPPQKGVGSCYSDYTIVNVKPFST
jgi:hypothetical protein